MAGLFKSKVKRVAEGAIQEAIASTINAELDALLQSIPLKLPVQGAPRHRSPSAA